MKESTVVIEFMKKVTMGDSEKSIFISDPNPNFSNVDDFDYSNFYEAHMRAHWIVKRPHNMVSGKLL